MWFCQDDSWFATENLSILYKVTKWEEHSLDKLLIWKFKPFFGQMAANASSCHCHCQTIRETLFQSDSAYTLDINFKKGLFDYVTLYEKWQWQIYLKLSFCTSVSDCRWQWLLNNYKSNPTVVDIVPLHKN